MSQLVYPKAARRLRLGMVGGGRGALVGEWHAMGIRMSNRWDLVAGALSSRPDVAKASGEDWMLDPQRTYTDYRDMAAREAAREDGIDAVVVCTPNGSHAAIAKAFLEAGIDVICDKPMTASMEDAADLVRVARNSGLFFGITYTYSFHAMARQMKAMVAKGMIGKVRQAHVEYVQDWASGAQEVQTKQSGWRRDPAQAGRGSATGDIGTHAFHLLHFVLDDSVQRVSARFHVCGGAPAMEDTAFMQLEMGSGAPATLWCTQAAPGNACGLRLRVYGESGGLEWDQERPDELRFAPVGEAPRLITRGAGEGILPEAAKSIRLPRGHAEGVPDAWCNCYTEMAIGVTARREGHALGPGVIDVPDVMDGARGVFFVDAAADSAETDGAWQPCWYEA
ncbi:MAG: Gfo/Idh/MocA family oxidoreductase [Pseudomonadota bacterium]